MVINIEARLVKNWGLTIVLFHILLMLIQVGICSQTAVCVHKLHTPQREIQKNCKANNFQDFLQHSYFLAYTIEYKHFSKQKNSCQMPIDLSKESSWPYNIKSSKNRKSSKISPKIDLSLNPGTLCAIVLQ